MSRSGSLEGFPVREPILDKNAERKFSSDQMDRQWRLVTEALRREILSDPEVRQQVIGFAATPVSESLPGIFLRRIANERVNQLLRRYGQGGIESYLSLAAVPDEQIRPDITNTPGLADPEHISKILKGYYGDDHEAYDQALQRYVEGGAFSQGITREERVMVAQRFRFARDVKMLILQAEALENQETVKAGRGEERLELPSGTVINFNTEVGSRTIDDLTSPQDWKKRQQLKDRVYEIQTGDSRYILKERKTSRHTDTKKGGHQSGLTSEAEFRTAEDFQRRGNVEQDDLKVSWEKPLSSVRFPDGFQFTIFDYEKGLIGNSTIVENLSQAIQTNREQYEAEYQTIRTAADKFKDDRDVKDAWSSSDSTELSFEEFVRVKALRLERRARNFLRETVAQLGYDNSDFDGYAFRINSGKACLQLEIIGFDFEYFTKIDDPRVKVETEKRNREYQRKNESRTGIGFLRWSDEQQVSRMQRAAYFAMLEKDGLLDSNERRR
jgi:hypothetical protein